MFLILFMHKYLYISQNIDTHFFVCPIFTRQVVFFAKFFPFLYVILTLSINYALLILSFKKTRCSQWWKFRRNDYISGGCSDIVIFPCLDFTNLWHGWVTVSYKTKNVLFYILCSQWIQGVCGGLRLTSINGSLVHELLLMPINHDFSVQHSLDSRLEA